LGGGPGLLLGLGVGFVSAAPAASEPQAQTSRHCTTVRLVRLLRALFGLLTLVPVRRVLPRRGFADGHGRAARPGGA
ncbi:hypothetical protein, partial [Streptomyces sp. NPDC002172]